MPLKKTSFWKKSFLFFNCQLKKKKKIIEDNS